MVGPRSRQPEMERLPVLSLPSLMRRPQDYLVAHIRMIWLSCLETKALWAWGGVQDQLMIHVLLSLGMTCWTMSPTPRGPISEHCDRGYTSCKLMFSLVQKPAIGLKGFLLRPCSPRAPFPSSPRLLPALPRRVGGWRCSLSLVRGTLEELLS